MDRHPPEGGAREGTPAVERAESSAVAALVALVGYWVSEDFQGALAVRAEVDVESRDVPALFLLGRQGAMRPGELARALRASPAQATRITGRLVGAGLAVSVVDAKDARASNIVLTPAGAQAARQLYDEGESMFADLLQGWSEPDKTQFAEHLSRVVGSLALR